MSSEQFSFASMLERYFRPVETGDPKFLHWIRIAASPVVEAPEAVVIVHPETGQPHTVRQEDAQWISEQGFRVLGMQSVHVLDRYPSSQGGATKAMAKLLVWPGSRNVVCFYRFENPSLSNQFEQQLAQQRMLGTPVQHAIEQAMDAVYPNCQSKITEGGFVYTVVDAQGQQALFVPRVQAIITEDGRMVRSQQDHRVMTLS